MTPSHILAVKLRALGDTILMTAPLLELRKRYPKSQIHILVPSVWSPLLENHPAIDRIWTLDCSLKGLPKLQELSKLALKLRKQRFDCVINFHASSSSAWISRLTGSPVRAIHFHGHHTPNRFSTVSIPGKGELKPAIERDSDTIRGLGIPLPSDLLPQVFPSAEEKEKAQAFIRAKNLSTPLLGINLGASRPTKLWPIESYALLAVQWSKTTQGSVLVFAGPGEENLLKHFFDSIPSILNKKFHDPVERQKFRRRIEGTSELSIRELSAVLTQVSVLVGGDSGPKHLAIAVGTPTVTLFGPEHPFEWHPYPIEKNPYLFIENLDCRKDADPGFPAWCALKECKAQKHFCMRGHSVESVLMNCQKVIST